MTVTGFDIQERTPVAGGASFGDSGPYEQISGVLRFAVDPAHPLNAIITDLGLAPRGDDGRVSFEADALVMRPLDPAKDNRRLLFDVLNRGNRTVLRRFNSDPRPQPGPDAEIGNGFLLRQGYTLLWCGWQHDVPSDGGRMALRPPEAMPDGKPMRGRVMVEFQLAQPARSTLLSDRGHQPYPAADLHEAGATLTVRDFVFGERRPIPRDRWQFARDEGGVPMPDLSYVYMADGFAPGRIYEVIYTAAGAPVVGLGLAAVRDAVAFLRYADAAAGNPCGSDGIEHAYSFGASQSGRWLREFLYTGMNEDEDGRLVFDGVIVHIAQHARGPFNHRFGQPSNMTYWYALGGQFPFTDGTQRDPLTGRSDGLLARLEARGKAPRVFFSNTANEYWRGGAALSHTDPAVQHDVDFSGNARGYLLAGTQHGSGSLPLSDVTADGSRTRYSLNSLDYSPLLRAALVNLDAWVSRGVEPPASRVPRLADGTAVPREEAAAQLAAIPGVTLPGEWGQVLPLDFGPGWAAGRMEELPPRPLAGPYRALVSRLDDDGNDAAGIRLPELAVPLATYTGWNLRHPDIGAPHLTHPLMGATLPFARIAAERAATGDPRPSIEERYASKEDYLSQVRAAAEALVTGRLLLEEDVPAVLFSAALRWDLFTTGGAAE